jgi:cobyrinic acid a,c-diamide synthase
MPAYAECGGLMYLCRSIEWNGDICNMVGCIDADIIMEKRPQGRGYVQLMETGNCPWPGASDNDKATHIINAHEFHYSRFKTVDKNVKFAFQVKRGTGITGKSDGYIYKNLVANYTHLRNTRNNPWAKRFIEFARNCKTQQNPD